MCLEQFLLSHRDGKEQKKGEINVILFFSSYRHRSLHRSAVTLSAIIATEVSSIFYINAISVVYHYVFASLSFFLVSI